MLNASWKSGKATQVMQRLAADFALAVAASAISVACAPASDVLCASSPLASRMTFVFSCAAPAMVSVTSEMIAP